MMYKHLVNATARAQIAARTAADHVQATTAVVTAPVQVAITKFNLDVDLEKLRIRYERGDLDEGQFNAGAVQLAIKHGKKVTQLKEFLFKEFDHAPLPDPA